MTAAHGTGKVFDFTRGDRFRRARLSAGHDSAQDFAELIGVSRNTISSTENDRSLPRPIVIRVKLPDHPPRRLPTLALMTTL